MVYFVPGALQKQIEREKENTFSVGTGGSFKRGKLIALKYLPMPVHVSSIPDSGNPGDGLSTFHWPKTTSV